MTNFVISSSAVENIAKNIGKEKVEVEHTCQNSIV